MQWRSVFVSVAMPSGSRYRYGFQKSVNYLFDGDALCFRSVTDHDAMTQRGMRKSLNVGDGSVDIARQQGPGFGSENHELGCA